MTIDKLATIGNITRSIQQADKVTLAGEIGKLLDKFTNSIKAELTGDDRAEIIVYIIEYYKDLSLKDIAKAFQLTVVQGYGDDVDYSFYNRFSAQYVCRFLNLYREYKRKENLKRPLAIAAPVKALPISEAANRETRRKIAELSYRDICNGKFFILINVDSVFEEMTAAGYTADWDQLMNHYVTKATATLKKPEPENSTEAPEKKRKSGLLANLIFNVPILNSIASNDLKEAKRLYIKEKFEYWKEQGRVCVFLESEEPK